MGPKKAKPRKGDENAVPEWQTLIEEGVLDEETWKVKVFIIDAAESEADRIYLTKFEFFSAQEKRFVIKNISKTETIFMINQLAAEKKAKEENLLVFEEANRYLKDKEDIPSEIYAMIIKHLILEMKEEYLFIKQAKLEVKEGLRQESRTMLGKEEVRGAVSVKRNDQPPQPSGKTGAGDAGDTIRPVDGKKYNTNLRVRGEEWRDKVYVDDYPVDGPNIYVSVTGFLDPLLAGCLIKIGVPLAAVIKISIDPAAYKIPSSLNPATKRGQSQLDVFSEKSTRFWSEMQHIRLHKSTTDTYVNTTFIIFSPPYWSMEQLSGNPEQIYDELCFLMYDVQDLTRQHLHYLDNMKIIEIPKDFESKRLNKKYNKKMHNIPLECVTLYSLINSMLESVCEDEDMQECDSESSASIEFAGQISTEDVKVNKARTLVRQVFNTLCKTHCDKSYRVTYGDEYENQKDPIIINYGDTSKYKTFHVRNMNLNKVVHSSLYCMPINKLWISKDLPNEELEAKIDFHYNVLLSCFEREDIDNDEANRLLHMLACRKLYNNRSSLKIGHIPEQTIDEFKKTYLKRTKLAEPLPGSRSFIKTSTPTPSPVITKSETMIANVNDTDSETSRIKCIFDCPDLSELVSAAEIAIQAAIGHLIENFEYFEDFSEATAFQVVLDAYNSYNCVEYKYCEVTDCFILMFYNNHDNDGISHHEWRSHLDSPVCLHDFFDFVLEEQYEWIQNEEKIYDENMMLKSLSLLKDSMEFFPKHCIDKVDIADELLMEGSLKHKELEKKLEETPIEPSTTAVSEKTEKTFTATDSEKTSAKKSPKGRKGQKAFVIKENEDKEESETGLFEEPKPFVGFDIGDRRVEVFGKDSAFYSNDGTKLSTSYKYFIPSNFEYVCLNVVPGITNCEFWLHKALGEYASSESLEMCESFRMTTKDQIIIYIKKQEFTVPVPIEVEEPPTPKSKDTAPTADDSQILYETQSFYSFIKTWPNGLVTESVYVENSDQISHIKQFYTQLLPNLEEENRCISLNGEVIIFKTNHEIEVLRPDGTHILITKVGKKAIKSEEDTVSLSQSSKANKSSAAKGSKKFVEDDDKEDPSMPYEIHIKEFEIIEPSGIREKWINDNGIYVEKIIIRTATDFCLGEIFTRRMDGTNTLLNKDGLHIVTFPNKTRIISSFLIEENLIYPEWTEEELDYLNMFNVETLKEESAGLVSQKSVTTNASATCSNFECLQEEEVSTVKYKDGYVSVQLTYVIEHVNFSTVTINKSENKITVDSPNNISLTVTAGNQYDITLDKATTARFDGNKLDINYEACNQCGSYTSCEISVANPDDISSDVEIDKAPKNWLKLKDSFNKRIIISEEGKLMVDEDELSKEVYQEDVTGDDNPEMNEDKQEEKREIKSECSVVSHEKCNNTYQKKSLRFMVLRRDLSCSELIHKSLVEEYKYKCRWQPWCSISEHETFADQRKIQNIILPININETEKWLMESKLADKPKYLTYKDLKKDDGKGFYHWMRPYARFCPQPKKPMNALPPRQPRAFVLRTLEKQWDETNREELSGAKEMISAILRYRNLMESGSESLLTVPLRDFRTEQEQSVDRKIFDVGSRIIIEDLKKRLEEDLLASVKPSITTKPPPSPPHEEFEGEGLEEDVSSETERSSALKEIEEAEAVSPALQKYWRQRAEELKEEQLYRQLLRDGNVPPYFHNVLGGAIWWEANNLATEAVTKSERHKTRCGCIGEEDEASTIRTRSTCKYKQNTTT